MVPEGLGYQFSQALTGRGDFGEEAGVVRAGIGESFGLLGLEVAEVGDLVTEFPEAIAEAGDANGGRAHIDAATPLAQVERGSDDGDL
jgi:hypothetical protein